MTLKATLVAGAPEVLLPAPSCCNVGQYGTPRVPGGAAWAAPMPPGDWVPPMTWPKGVAALPAEAVPPKPPKLGVAACAVDGEPNRPPPLGMACPNGVADVAGVPKGALLSGAPKPDVTCVGGARGKGGLSTPPWGCGDTAAPGTGRTAGEAPKTLCCCGWATPNAGWPAACVPNAGAAPNAPPWLRDTAGDTG